MERLLKEGELSNREGNISEAFHFFTEAEKVLEQNYSMFTVMDQIQALKKVKEFIGTSGYAIERRDVIKKLIHLTSQAMPYNRLDLALCYHDLGYTYERYQYYKLMLKAMIRSREILDQVQTDLSCGTAEEAEQNSFYDVAALIYTSLGYAYLKNHDNDNAKKWFLDAEALSMKSDISISNKSRAFILNGLHRYYNLLGDTTKAITTLDAALELRRDLYNSSDDAERIMPRHIINSHSNKIQIYLKKGQLQKAEDEYFACMSENNIEERLWNFPDARYRILKDYGDILQANGKFEKAYSTYKKALQHRRYLHIATDIIAANLYAKMASSLKGMDCQEKALEYLIQSYVLQKKIRGSDHPELNPIRLHIEELGKNLSYVSGTIEDRIEIQSGFLEYRYDERIDNLEERLIQEFEL